MGAVSDSWQQVSVSDDGKSFQGYVNGKYLTQDLTAAPRPMIITEPPESGRSVFCGSESTPVEFVICSDFDLSRDDNAMAKSFNILLMRISDPAALRRSQRQWIKDRELNCNIPVRGGLQSQYPRA